MHDAKDIAKRNFYNYKQGEHKSIAIHAKNVKALYAVIYHYNADLIDTDTTRHEKDTDKSLNNSVAITKARNRIIGLATIKSCKYPEVYTEIKKEYLYKNNVYPEDGVKSKEQIQDYMSAMNSKKRANRTGRTTVGRHLKTTPNLKPKRNWENNIIRWMI
mmetsp:Transcript_15366/g.21935  ORF Transcript_15366/g.21935 Transcript_15366/m.21935 type:complete len:160 (+) Transcript_15366:190-669(+)